MIWINHSRDFPKGSHTMFSPSQPLWMKDQTEDDILKRYRAYVSTKIGTIVHEQASDYISARMTLTKKEAAKILTVALVKNGVSRLSFDPNTLASNFVNFVNDSIGYGMSSEVALVYSAVCGGTADAIIFDERKKILRISDLKTGMAPAKFEQLEGYAALFFLEYGQILGVKPEETQIECRIYQNGEVLEEFPTAEEIVPIMNSCIWHTQVVQSIEKG